jgi:hypothetical protein
VDTETPRSRIRRILNPPRPPAKRKYISTGRPAHRPKLYIAPCHAAYELDEHINPEPDDETMADGNLRKLFRSNLKGFDMIAVETGSTDGGVPDLNYCKDGIEGWVEMKRVEHWRVAIRPAQVGWAERRIAHGGRVFMAVRKERNQLWLFRGEVIRALLDTRVDEVPSLGFWFGGPSKWDWTAIEQLLLYK